MRKPDLSQYRARQQRLRVTAILALLVVGCRPGADSTAEQTPFGPGSQTPHLARAADGRVVLSWLEKDGDATVLRVASREEDTWSRPRTVARGDNWFVNWADFPSVEPINDSLWAAHWLVKRPGGTYAYDVAVSLSSDGGRTWGQPVSPHTDGTATEHGFVSLFADGDAVGAVWLDGRAMSADNDHDNHGAGAMTLRSVRINTDRSLAAGSVLDDRVCDCCQTDVAIADAGPVAVYRNRTGDEVRDIYVARQLDGQWQAGTPVADDGWVIDGCPVNGPAVAAAGNRVAVAWFTAADDRARVQLAVSDDGGASFAIPMLIDGNAPVGRVDVTLLEDGTIVTSWIAPRPGGRGSVMVRALRPDGSLGSAYEVGATSLARRAGFPQMLRDDDGLLLAWTELTEDTQRVRTTWLAAASIR